MKCVRKDVCSCWKINMDELTQLEKDSKSIINYRWVAQLIRFRRFSYIQIPDKDEVIFQSQTSNGKYSIGYEGDYLVLYALGDVQIYSEPLFHAMFDIVEEDSVEI